MGPIQKAIVDAAESLTEETWHKGSYFSTRDGKLCMCAHGALQAQVNPTVRNSLAPGDTAVQAGLAEASAAAAEAEAEPGAVAAEAVAAVWQAAVVAREAIKAAERAAFEAEHYKAPLRGLRATGVWENRPIWVRETSEKYGNTEAHYILGMVGLTASYNDAEKTTLSDVKAKFAEAATLAESLGV